MLYETIEKMFNEKYSFMEFMFDEKILCKESERYLLEFLDFYSHKFFEKAILTVKEFVKICHFEKLSKYDKEFFAVYFHKIPYFYNQKMISLMQYYFSYGNEGFLKFLQQINENFNGMELK